MERWRGEGPELEIPACNWELSHVDAESWKWVTCPGAWEMLSLVGLPKSRQVLQP